MDKPHNRKIDYQTVFCKTTSQSLDGDLFTISEGETALITRIYEKKMLGEILFQGFIGLFDLNDFEISPMNSLKIAKKLLETEENIENDNFEGKDSREIPKVLLRKKMMETRNNAEKSRSKSPINNIKSKIFDTRTVCGKRANDNEIENWNYGRMTFQVKEK